jgi:hypothetical protein
MTLELLSPTHVGKVYVLENGFGERDAIEYRVARCYSHHQVFERCACSFGCECRE